MYICPPIVGYVHSLTFALRVHVSETTVQVEPLNISRRMMTAHHHYLIPDIYSGLSELAAKGDFWCLPLTQVELVQRHHNDYFKI